MKMNLLKQTHDRPSVLNTEELAAITKIESELLRSARKYFEENGFKEVVVPHITRVTGACENIDTLFELNYFGEQGYLVQTGQLYLEALIPKLGSVFCIGPSFRAEPDIDERHLTEFTLVEIEFPGDFRELLVHIENIIYEMIQGALKCRKELELLGVDPARLEKITKPFQRVTYTEAINMLQKKGLDVKWGDDLKSKHEKLLAINPTFITHYPEAIKFFNMRRNENPEVVNSSDLVLPFSGEAVGAAEREFDHELLVEKLEKSPMYEQLLKRGKTIEDFRWYLDIVKNHSVQHSGCGIGLNRVMQFILGTDDIRASTAFPMNKESLM